MDDKDDALVGMVTPRDSDEARAGDDLIFRVCGVDLFFFVVFVSS
jgi:hypothetical protein